MASCRERQDNCSSIHEIAQESTVINSSIQLSLST